MEPMGLIAWFIMGGVAFVGAVIILLLFDGFYHQHRVLT
jgi:hypothetical protein